MTNDNSLSRELLFEPLTLRGLTISNRIVMAPMTRGFCPDGVPHDGVATYYRRRAEGGAGLILTEGVAVDHPSALGDAGLQECNVPFLAGEASLAGWRHVVDEVHAVGGRIIPQLWHQGVMRKRGTGPYPSAPTLSPSGIWGPLGMTSIDPQSIPADPVIGEPMTEAEIEEVIEAFVRCARNAAAVGFDGIALHGGHGYLLDNFLWEQTNRRDDRWGGDRTRRSAFPAEIVRRIRAAVGDDLPIFFRFSQWKQQDFRATLADNPAELAEVLMPLADAGVDVFDASVRYYNRAAFDGSPMNLAGWARRVTGKMSVAVGGIGASQGMYDKGTSDVAAIDYTPLLQRFANKEFDLVAVGRAMIGDPAWGNKFRSGQLPRPYDQQDVKTLA
ncbi:12-oxophytodienoate reductase [Niveispirillum sp. SYP-B3756]|uniref:NADH:flavin oxidoreductase n=1 Tax=Niveispirillum sp. SYP-B3756 TaxID=2662178 RepID=UPI00129275E6|nr:NADH:flavin oxidoreductase [Niveispirillum sp. SYP-B3756]MQP68311.1 12-oxophytodienoate reductase [Niveispirillum sp. SYP-B3756]